MAELGYDLSAHVSKSLEEVKEHAPFDAVVTMGCGDACPWMPAKRCVVTGQDLSSCVTNTRGGWRPGRTVNWQIPDPKHLEPEEFNKVRDIVRDHVKGLLTELGVQQVGGPRNEGDGFSMGVVRARCYVACGWADTACSGGPVG